MKGSIIILLLIYSGCVVASMDIVGAKKDIEAYIEGSRDIECWGPGYIEYFKTSQIAGEHYFFAVYGYEMGPCRDRNGWQYLGVFQEIDGSIKLVTKELVGGKGKLDISGIQLNDQKVFLVGKSWGKTDPMCCPSIETVVGYGLNGGQLKIISSPNNKPQATATPPLELRRYIVE